MSDLIEHGSAPWQAIPRELLRDPRLSPRAKGGLVTLLSHEDGWIRSAIAILQRENDCGRAQAQAIMKELRDAGYAELVTKRGDGGRLTSHYVVRPEPPESDADTEPASSAASTSDSPEVGSPVAGAPVARSTARRSNRPAVPRPAVVDPPDEEPQGEVQTLERGKPREKDPAFDALARVTGKNALRMTEAEKKQTGVALAQIVQAEKARHDVPVVDRQELKRGIQHAAVQYRRLHPTWELTPFALVLHWSELFGDVRPAKVSPFDGHRFEPSTADPDSICKACGEAAYRHTRSLEAEREGRDAAAELAAHARVAVEDEPQPAPAVSA